MTPEDQLKRALGKYYNKTALRSIGEGIVRNVRDNVCDIERSDLPALLDARLMSVEELASNYVIVVPTEGSAVLYGIIDNQIAEAVVLKCSEIDKVHIKVGGTEYQIDKEGHLIKRDAETLQKIICDFITEVQKIIVVQGRSPDVAALTQISNRVKKLLQ